MSRFNQHHLIVMDNLDIAKPIQGGTEYKTLIVLAAMEAGGLSYWQHLSFACVETTSGELIQCE